MVLTAYEYDGRIHLTLHLTLQPETITLKLLQSQPMAEDRETLKALLWEWMAIFLFKICRKDSQKP